MKRRRARNFSRSFANGPAEFEKKIDSLLSTYNVCVSFDVFYKHQSSDSPLA
jgi:hypothetical protein